ncbi:MAG: alpha-glucan family phosphorylase [Limnochordia bacterium]|jgi:starch phosphorylase|nr:alpha-glucan family phosphorylase [Bacillota bacterium]HOB08620.1 alpha-glucan family phosphorylase [Limnochordia bacterium]NLH31982.1 alpha-glucan family phosphorylase [Bacillota bacterium]HPT92768.1 alpha-glucan family phosphorylase [Limnochordia bacterium]HPZ30761.1 alpha-glucan family phosphorylase [Limnochordia bacterium]
MGTYGQRRPTVAYFCMEFGLDESFPVYSGGLGILAGDLLKAAKDLDLPFIGVGILWDEGYTDQFIDKDHRPYDCAQEYSREHLIDTGVTVTVKIRNQDVKCQVWKTEKFGNVPLYLLDASVDPENAWITRQLYYGDGQDRVAAEMVLGIGGVRALRALGIDVDIYHLNEGHAVFCGFELIREHMQRGMSFEHAWEAARQQIVFTTHTPVMAGNEEHPHDLLQYMGAYNGLNYEQAAQVGGDPFNMTVAGLRLSYIANGVSQLHGMTARSMWRGNHGTSPIIAITNGVHQKTWQHPQIAQIYQTQGNLWRPHMTAKRQLLKYIEDKTGARLDPDCLLIGFARRMAAYKRSGLIFHSMRIIEPLLKDRVVQLVFSGKAHPLDNVGKQIAENLMQYVERFPESVVFLENYHMGIAKLMVSGCDVWLNTPQRPLEASGTSGMKAALNGVLNVSILDGWWPEGCVHGENGWQVGGGYEGPEQTRVDAASLYDVLLNEVIPTYYENRKKWVEMMNKSVAMAENRFTIERTITEYYNLMYQPATTLRDIKQQVSDLEASEAYTEVLPEPVHV